MSETNNNGWKRSKEARQKMSKAFQKSKKFMTCPHCGIIANVNMARRWHFDNCKSNPKSDRYVEFDKAAIKQKRYWETKAEQQLLVVLSFEVMKKIYSGK